MTTTIYKYEVPIADEFTLLLPTGAEVLTAQVQPYVGPCIWVRLDLANETVARKFRLAGTGHSVDDRFNRYIGTFQLHDGSIVLHLFEESE